MRPLPVRNPRSPWESTHVDYLGEPPATPLEIFEDETKNVLSKNDSPDVGFRWSVNPYRGCYHGCAYCYARPTHEYLGFGAGTDFERKIVVKRRAAELLREAFARRSWKGEAVVFSGNTDCYQPLEATYRLTRGCLEACADFGNPCHIITKAPLVERDLDVLGRLAADDLVGVTVSVPFFDERMARLIEPGVATPSRRLLTVQRLAEAGIRVSVNVAPVIPGLTDRDIPKILEAAARAGATSAGMTMLRLPGNVAEVFEQRLREAFPLSAEKVLARTREMRGGKLNDPAFGSRMRGEGEYADAIARLFDATARRFGLVTGEPRERPSRSAVRPQPAPVKGQLSLFGSTEKGAS
ncbi:MAG TPA: PA0069 family radical SAM protein [Polyangiaceae bacterium]|jgi:DNA repair photolyase|nr:PA0069 family radical SAM protein [Polyangiaceae bacterium]